MKRCNRCVMPESFPGIIFDSGGLCSLCGEFGKGDRLIPLREKLHGKFTAIIDGCRLRNLKYDALVAFSGGKDSTFLVHTLKERYGLNILSFTFDNGFMYRGAMENIRNVLGTLDVDHMVVRPARGLMKEIFSQSAAAPVYPAHLLRFGSAVCISCIRMVNTMSLRIAIEKQIPMVMLGKSPGQLIQSENEIIFQDNGIPLGQRKALFKPLADRVGDAAYYYLMLDKKEYSAKRFPHTVNPFPLIGYDEEEIYRTIETLGWKKNDDVAQNSTHCRLNSLGIVKHKERYNFHPYDYEMSMLVRLNIISRENALKRVEDPDEKAIGLAKEVELELFS